MKKPKLSARDGVPSLLGILLGVVLLPWVLLAEEPWRILIVNDTCPDITWGFTEEQVRQGFSDLVGAHLDEMNRTDGEPAENRDHFTMATSQEATDFIERNPGRRDELMRRIREGRITLSPFLCNSLWGFQSTEGAIRTLYPARRLERAWGVRMDVAHHIECPSLPWGQATILAGCGVKWVSVPFLEYDSTFKGLTNPPFFRLQGPDGAEVRVILDAFSSLKANYAQGAYLLEKPERISAEWLPHYVALGKEYPIRTLLASGTHSDISPDSWRRARTFADGIIRYNAAGTNPVTLLNGSIADFTRMLDSAEQTSAFLPVVRGCFGHSWESWPVSLAKYAGAMRVNERAFLAAEALVALAASGDPGIAVNTRGDRQQAEWCWAMLSDHAWNGTNPKNRQHNADLRRLWGERLGRISTQLTQRAWESLGLKRDERFVTVFNPLSFPNDILVLCDVPAGMNGVSADGIRLPAQIVSDSGRRQIAFIAAEVPACGFKGFAFESELVSSPVLSSLHCTREGIEGPYYRVRVDPKTGGLSSVRHRATEQELVLSTEGRSAGQTILLDGKEHGLDDVQTEVVADGPVFARLRVGGHIGDLQITNLVTLYQTLDRVDLDVQLHGRLSTNEHRLCQLFPVGCRRQELHIETTGAVLSPGRSPDGDLLAGADARRFAVQGFVDAAPNGRAGLLVSPRESYLLRLDQDTLAFEALGNDQNYKEVTRDQDGVTDFLFRYSLRGHKPGFNNAAAVAWSRGVQAPLVFAAGRLPKSQLNRPHIIMDPARAIATCFKPSDDDPSNTLVRLWETAGRSGPLILTVPGYRSAKETDLLERDRGALVLQDGRVRLEVRGYGLGAVLLQP